jgi:transcriptional regulator with XRE-family HTH domain
MDRDSVGRTVQWARRRAGLTQEALASLLDMPQPSVARIESGAVTPRASTLIALLGATGYRLEVEPIDPPVDLAPIRRRLALAVPMRTRQALGPAATRDVRKSPTWVLRQLHRFGVPFVLVGALAEAARGSPLRSRRAIEVVHPKTGLALDDLRVTRTSGTRLRLLTETAAGDDYETLVRTADRMLVDTGLRIRVASIEDLIRARRAEGTPRSREAAAILRAIARVDLTAACPSSAPGP